MSERRRETRVLTLKTGTIVVADGATLTTCAVLDTSQHGACILLPREADIPSTFDLVLDKAQTKHRCTLKWKVGNKIGVLVDTLWDGCGESD